MNESKPPAAFYIHPSSFRDPSGFIFRYKDAIYRQVNHSFREHFDHFISSGLYDTLVKEKKWIAHETVTENLLQDEKAYKILKPEPIGCISYAWEWSFEMLKDAALLTLELARKALDHDMVLKDATPFNIQWHHDRLIFIDTLSFEKYEADRPWIAYRPFCENFLGPLLLMHYRKISLQQLFLGWPDGIPVSLVQKLLPWRSRFSMLTYLHIHLHAKMASKKNNRDETKTHLAKKKLYQLISSLEMLVNRLQCPDTGTTWGDYYEEASQRKDYISQKKNIIAQWVDDLPGCQTGIDVGSNEGEFSDVLAKKGLQVLALDADPVAVNKLYKKVKEGRLKNIQPLIADLSYPSPAMGVNNKERAALHERIKNRDIGFCLALLHHLCLGKNIPFAPIAEWLSGLCRFLVIEFVPLQDPRSQQLVALKKDIYGWYTIHAFENIFGEYFRVMDKAPVPGTERVLFLMERQPPA